MARFSTTMVAFCLLAVPACKGKNKNVDPVKLVPEQAQLIAGLDLKGIKGSALYAENKDFLESQEDYTKWKKTAADCNVDFEGLDSLTLGTDSEDNAVLVIKGTGIGKSENLKCAAEKAKEHGGKELLEIEEKEGKTVLNFKEKAGADVPVGYVVNDNMVVVASKGWAPNVVQLLDGKGKAAVDASLKAPYSRADIKKHIWFAGQIPEMAKDQEELKAASDLTGGIDLAAGFAVALKVGYADAEAAKKVATGLQEKFDGVKALAGMMQIPQGVVDSVKIESQDSALALSAAATMDDINKLKAIAGKAAGMGMGGPPPGMAPGMGGPPPGMAPGMAPTPGGVPGGVPGGAPAPAANQPPAVPPAGAGQAPPAGAAPAGEAK